MSLCPYLSQMEPLVFPLPSLQKQQAAYSSEHLQSAYLQEYPANNNTTTLRGVIISHLAGRILRLS